MTNQELLNMIFELCLVPLLIVLTTYICNFFKKKSAEIQEKVDSDLADKYIDMFEQTLSSCVLATTQTYVDSLKAKNAFTLEAQKEAFDMTLNAVLAILTDEAKLYLSEIYGDFELYTKQRIEAEVKLNK